MTSNGVSVVICCHNSKGRLKPTLQHLLNQKTIKSIPWEVVIIDNASTDGTASFAHECWSSDAPAQLRVIQEPRLGLSFARKRGFLDAQFELVSFIDDDNWVAQDWIEKVCQVMMEHPEAGACGGKIEAVCEVEPPAWFERYKHKFAVGNQANASSDVTWNRGFLWGAGLTIRKSAWNFMINHGFQPTLTGRSGNRLLAGDDSEICLALRLAGWKLWYDERLTLQHYLPAERLRWEYLKKLIRGFGASSILLAPYHLAIIKDIKTIRGRTGKIWLWRLLSALERFIQLEIKRILKHFSDSDDRELERQRMIGSIQEALKIREKFDIYVDIVYNAKWNVIRDQ